MNEKVSLNIIKFIQEVKKYPQIWDTSHEDFKTRKKVTNSGVWREVAISLIPNYVDMDQEQQIYVVRQVYSKWRNIRDAHVRNLKQQRHTPLLGRKRSPYLYAKQLEFLNSQYNLGSEETNSDDQSSDDEQTNNNNETNVTKATDCVINENSSTSEDNERPLKRRRESINRTIEFVDTPMPNVEVNYPEKIPPVLDEDRAFFESMLPAVRQLNLDQKLEFRCELLKLINNIRKDVKCDGRSQLISDIFVKEEGTLILK